MADATTVPLWVLLAVPTVTGVAAIAGATITVWRGNRGAERRADAIRRDEWKDGRRKAAAGVAVCAAQLASAGRRVASDSGLNAGSSVQQETRLDYVDAAAAFQSALAAFRLVEDSDQVKDELSRLLSAAEMTASVLGKAQNSYPLEAGDRAAIRRCATELESAGLEFADAMRRLLAPTGL